jgi:rubrerythrin
LNLPNSLRALMITPDQRVIQLIAERIVIETYRELARDFDQKDPVSRRMMEEILAEEEEHADELADLLFAVEPESGEVSSRLHFKDEIPGESNAGRSVSAQKTAAVKHNAKKAARPRPTLRRGIILSAH